MKALRILLASMLLAPSSIYANTPAPSPIFPGSVFSGFGEKGEGKIEVTIYGGIVHEGHYFFPKGVSLYQLLMAIGDVDFAKTEYVPQHFYISRPQNGQTGKRKDYLFHHLSIDELKKVILEQDAHCYVCPQI
jgi:hypothetical protein